MFKQSRVGLFLIAAGVIALDQYTKALVRAHLPLNVSWNPIAWLDPIVTFTHVQNTGAAFGLLPQFGGMFILIALVVVLLIILFYKQLAQGSFLLQVAFGLQLGGALGNLCDRLARGYVTDFIDFRWWPVFNVADSAIVVGTILLVYYVLFIEGAKERANAPQNDIAPRA
ncbi:MAG: signal peptidase II [Chloroflexi bacterium]|nr:signal peptidase II [Chloroflexota bacterium]